MAPCRAKSWQLLLLVPVLRTLLIDGLGLLMGVDDTGKTVVLVDLEPRLPVVEFVNLQTLFWGMQTFPQGLPFLQVKALADNGAKVCSSP
jgi:hypothetical protein